MVVVGGVKYVVVVLYLVKFWGDNIGMLIIVLVLMIILGVGVKWLVGVVYVLGIVVLVMV